MGGAETGGGGETGELWFQVMHFFRHNIDYLISYYEGCLIVNYKTLKIIIYYFTDYNKGFYNLYFLLGPSIR